MSLFRLTGREAEVLAVMLVFRDEPDGELAYERGSAYLGNTPLSARLVFGLIRKMCISERGEPSPVEHYYVNETGTRALRDHWGIAARAAEKEKDHGPR